MKQVSLRSKATAYFFASICTFVAQRALAIEGPSFECTTASRSPLAFILCNSPKAAQADWEVNSAYWASYEDDRGEVTFNQFVIQRCALPKLLTERERAGRAAAEVFGQIILGQRLPNMSAGSTITNRHVACVVDLFYQRARELRSKLTGAALSEAMMSPEDHIAVQQNLVSKGFFVKADGQFGPTTRKALRDFQRSLGAQETGFLTGEQLAELENTPEKKAARLQEEKQKEFAEKERARKEAVDAQLQADLDEKRRRLKEEAVQAQLQAELDKNRKRLEEEAAKATEWRLKIEEAKEKGTKFANSNRTKWTLSQQNDPMMDDKIYRVQSEQRNGSGALAEIEGACSNGEVLFLATLLNDEDRSSPLRFGANDSEGRGISGRKRVNDTPAFATFFLTSKWRNRIVLSKLSFKGEASANATSRIESSPVSADTTWRILAEIETSKGALLITIPTFEPNIVKLISVCRTKWERG